MQQRNAGWWYEICEVLPDLKNLAGTPQPIEYHAEGDVAAHTKRAIEACPHDCDPDLLWVALLHDIGKPDTTFQKKDGRIIAHGHAKHGAHLAEKILTRLNMSSDRCNRIVWGIRHHMFQHSWQINTPKELTKRQRTYLLDARFSLLLEFLRIDSIASEGNNKGMQAFKFYTKLRVDLLASEAKEPT